MRSTYLIAGAIVLALVAAGVLFGTNFFQTNPFGQSDSEIAQLAVQMKALGSNGGFVATFDEGSEKGWQLADGNRLERFRLSDANTVLARLTSAHGLDKKLLTWTTLGLSAVLPKQLNDDFIGKKIEVGLLVRAPRNNPSPEISVVYATQQWGNSGWRQIKPSSRFELRTFTFDVPKVQSFIVPPILVIHSDPAGKGRSVELLGIYVRAAPIGQ
jgi:hypothetical protein